MESDVLERARAKLKEVGARVTLARVQVLASLLDAGRALTHHEVQQRLEAAAGVEPFDRVTLYRVLDWLVEQQLAHRVSADDRVFRFSAQPAHGSDPHDGTHGHFRCLQCGRIVCLPDSPGLDGALRELLPTGYAGARVDLTVHGRCDRCADPHGQQERQQ